MIMFQSGLSASWVGPILSRIRSSVTVSSSARADKLIWDSATTVRRSCRSMDASYFTWSTVQGELNCVRDRRLLRSYGINTTGVVYTIE